MVMIDKLNWSSHSRELEADRSGWQPNKRGQIKIKLSKFQLFNFDLTPII